MLEELHPVQNARLQAITNISFRNLHSRQTLCLHKYSQSLRQIKSTLLITILSIQITQNIRQPWAWLPDP